MLIEDERFDVRASSGLQPMTCTQTPTVFIYLIFHMSGGTGDQSQWHPSSPTRYSNFHRHQHTRSASITFEYLSDNVTTVAIADLSCLELFCNVVVPLFSAKEESREALQDKEALVGNSLLLVTPSLPLAPKPLPPRLSHRQNTRTISN